MRLRSKLVMDGECVMVCAVFQAFSAARMLLVGLAICFTSTAFSETYSHSRVAKFAVHEATFSRHPTVHAELPRYAASAEVRGLRDCGQYAADLQNFFDQNLPVNASRILIVFRELFTNGDEGCGYNSVFDADSPNNATEVESFANNLRHVLRFGEQPKVERYASFYVHLSLDGVKIDSSSPQNGMTVFSHASSAKSFLSYFQYVAWLQEIRPSMNTEQTFLDFASMTFGRVAANDIQSVFPESNAILVQLEGNLLLQSGEIASFLLPDAKVTLGRDCRGSVNGHCW